MNHNTNILIDNKITIEGIVDSISSKMKIKFYKIFKNREVTYQSVYENENIYIDGNHGLEDDCGISFSDYKFIVSVDSNKSYGDEIKITKARQEFCFIIASLLRNKYHCNILVIEDLQVLLKSNETTFNYDSKSLIRRS